MGLFTKKERVHFERDEEGNVIRMTRNGKEVQPVQPEPKPEPQPKYKSTEQLHKEFYAKHPEEMPWRERRKKEKAIFREEFNKARIARIRQQGKQAGSTTLSDRLNRMIGTSGTGYKTKNNYNPIGSMFDSGMPGISRKKGSKKKYTVISGKAYPIAGTGKKKKKKRKSTGFGGFDPMNMDNYGFFK